MLVTGDMWHMTCETLHITLLSAGINKFSVSCILHSEILASYNFNKNYNFVPWIWEHPYIKNIEMLFTNITAYISVVGKMPDQYLNVSFYSNQGYKVQILVESRGQICPIVSPELDYNDTLKCWSGVFKQPWYLWQSFRLREEA